MLEVRHLCCVRNERELFAQLSFTLQAGQAVQVRGANGSGKTSLLRILCGLSLPEEGEVRWQGEDIDSLRADYLANIAYIGHANGIKEELTALENLRFAGALTQVSRAATPRQALETVGLADRVDAPCAMLSAGQHRRVALARLLLTAAPLWILDEPFTALDSVSRVWIEGLLRQHIAAGGMLVLSTHQGADLGASPVTKVSLDASTPSSLY